MVAPEPDDQRAPLGQRLLDRPFLLLVAGLLVMFGFYTLWGLYEILTLPKATSSGRIFRLKGRGVHNTTTGHTGDQLVTVRIVLPETIDDELSYFLSEWRQKHKYDPGRP